MATSKTLTPTNVTIQIPEFTDQPDQRVNSNCIDKEADAINALFTVQDVKSQITFLNTDKLVDNSDRCRFMRIGKIVVADLVLRIAGSISADSHLEAFSVPSALIPKSNNWQGFPAIITNIASGAFVNSEAYITVNAGTFYVHPKSSYSAGNNAFMAQIVWAIN